MHGAALRLCTGDRAVLLRSSCALEIELCSGDQDVHWRDYLVAERGLQ